MGGERIPLFEMIIRCPECGSWKVRPNGTKMSGARCAESFICKNPKCLTTRHKNGFKKGNQFIINTSYEFQQLIHDKLRALYEDLLQDGAKSSTITKKYRISESEISALRREIEGEIEAHYTLDSLVNMPQPDKAIAIDEPFLNIEGKNLYFIIATGYTLRKMLGIKVSFTRTEQDMRDVFDEAERNTAEPITTLTSDAWGATIAMVKNLGRVITNVLHKHKKPYNKAVIKRYEYDNEARIKITIGVKTDVTKRRAQRQGHYLITKGPIDPPPSKKRGRPKGSKNKKRKKTPSRKRKKKHGRQGLFKAFDKDKMFSLQIDPYRKTVNVSKSLPASIGTALTEVTLRYFLLVRAYKTISQRIKILSSSHC